MVGPKEDAHTTDADEDADDLGGVVADVEEDEGDEDDHYDRPEVDQLGYVGGESVSFCGFEANDYAFAMQRIRRVKRSLLRREIGPWGPISRLDGKQRIKLE